MFALGTDVVPVCLAMTTVRMTSINRLWVEPLTGMIDVPYPRKSVRGSWTQNRVVKHS